MRKAFKYTAVSFLTDHSLNPEVLIQVKLDENLGCLRNTKNMSRYI